jgi:hypothetical protein
MFSEKEDTIITDLSIFLFFQDTTAPGVPGPPHYKDFAIILRHTTVGRTPLDEWSARRRVLYLTTINIYMRQASIPAAGFEPAIPASERPQTHALDRPAISIGTDSSYHIIISFYSWLI